MQTLHTVWTTEALVYRDRAVLATTLPLTDNSLQAQRRAIDELSGRFTSYGLRKVDRYLRPEHESTGVEAALFDSGVVTLFSAESWFPGAAVPEGQWLQLVQESLSCTFLVTVGNVESSFESHIRQQGGRGLYLGATVPLKDNRLGSSVQTRSRYQFLSSRRTGRPPAPSTSALFLDSNVLLDLEKVAQGKAPLAVFEQLRRVVVDLWYQDVRPGLATGELCWSGVDGEYRADRFMSLMATVNAWFDDRSQPNFGPEDIQRRWTIEYSKRRGTSAESPPDVRFLVGGIYCSLLKLSTLLLSIDRFKANQRVEFLGEYCRYANEELGFYSTYALQVAIDSLIGAPSRNEYTRKLLKFSKNVLQDIWGASWDLTLLAAADWSAGGEFERLPGHEVGIVTADKALATLRSRVAREETMAIRNRHNLRHVMSLTYVVDKRLESKSSEILKVLEGATSHTRDRLFLLSDERRPENLPLIRTKIAKLEAVVLALNHRRSSRRY